MRVLVALASFGAAASEPIVVGKTFMAGSVDPTSGSTGWALTSHGVSENLFTVNKDGEIVGQVAESVSKVSELIWDVTLKSGYKFSDGTDVTAQAVADCLSELNSVNSNAQATIGTMTVTAPSATVVRIESTISTHIMDSVLAEWVFTIYKTDGSDYVFTGPYKIESFVAGDYIDLVPNTHYIDSKHGERHPIKIKRYGSSDLAAAAIAGEVDVGFHLPADATTLADVRAASAVHVRTFEVGYHYMMFHNIGQNSGRAINDVRVREAIDLALDRDAISQALAGGHGTRSLFPDYTPWYQEGLGVSHGDLTAAGAKLDEAGWTLDSSTGKRTKNGEDLTIDLVAYAFRPDLGRMQPAIGDALGAVGITVNEIMTQDGSYDNTGYDDDWTEIMDRLAAGDWDLLLWAQNTLPAGDPAWFLRAFFRSDGGNNHAGLNSATVDGLLDTLADADVHAARVTATADAHAAILAEQAVSNLVTPEWHVSLSDCVVDYVPWGSDYYVIRPDLFVPAATPCTRPQVSPSYSYSSYCPAEVAAWQDCVNNIGDDFSADDDWFGDDDGGDDDDGAPGTCAEAQPLVDELCVGPSGSASACDAEYKTWIECEYEGVALNDLGLTCDFSCTEYPALGSDAAAAQGRLVVATAFLAAGATALAL